MSERQVQTLITWFEENDHLTYVIKDTEGFHIIDIPIEYTVS